MKFKEFLSRKKPDILTFVGLGGMIGFGVMLYRARPKVDKELEESEEPLTKKEKAWVYVRNLWPAALVGVGSSICIVLGNREHNKRSAAIAAAYYLSESTLKTYQEKVIEEIGEKKERGIRDKVAAEKQAKHPYAEDRTLFISDTNKPWIYDAVLDKYYRANVETVRRAIAEANVDMYKFNYVSVRELYYKMDVFLGDKWDDLGWNISDGEIDIWFTSTITEIEGVEQPCMVLEYRGKPNPHYMSNWNY